MSSIDRKLLALALNHQKFAMEVTESTTHLYYTEDLQWLFNAIKHYFSNPNIKSIPSRDMVEEFVSSNVQRDNMMSVFDSVSGMTVDTNEFKWLLEKIKFRYNNYLQTQASAKITEIQSKQTLNRERVEEINGELKRIVSEIDTIHRKETYKEGSLRDSAVERAKHYNYVEAHPESAQGILSGFGTFDQITNGIRAGEFLIVAADTGCGKSIFMHNYAVNAYMGKNTLDTLPCDIDDSGKNILYFTLEMPKEVQERRIDACIAGIYSNHIRDGLLSEEDKRQYFKALEFQKRYPKHFHIVDMPKQITPRDIELKYLEVCESGVIPDLVVIDYMGIMSANNSLGSDWMDLGFISAELHEFCRVHDVATITASQVNRPKDGNEKYDTNRIARSSMIPNNANIIIQIAKRNDEELRTDMLVHIIKMRDGEKRPFTLSKDFGRMRIIDLADDTYSDGDGNDFI